MIIGGYIEENKKLLCVPFIPGSSKCVKFVPFHEKHIQKGRKFRCLEDPGIHLKRKNGSPS